MIPLQLLLPLPPTQSSPNTPPVDTGPFNLPCAPIFYPTEEEFKNTWEYLNSIRETVEKTGICVIQPPRTGLTWDFQSFKKFVNPKKFSFVTKAQNLHQMNRRIGPNILFLMKLKKFWKNLGHPLVVMPEVGGVVLDMYQLNIAVDKKGGLTMVEQRNQWVEIARELKLLAPDDSPRTVTITSASLRNHYHQYLLPFLNSGEISAEKPTVPENISEEPKKENLKIDSDLKIESDELRENSPPPTPLEEEEEGKKRKYQWEEDNRPVKRMKSLTEKDEPLWSQVKSRSFAKDANDIRESLFSSPPPPPIPRANKMGSKASTPSPLIYDDHDPDMSDEEGAEDPSVLTKDFGYGLGRRFTLAKFRDMALKFEKRWGHCNSLPTKEREYWRIVESGEEFMQVQYGSDLDVSAHGSGFPFNPDSKIPHVSKKRVKKQHRNSEPPEFMIKSGWNTNNIAESTFLNHLQESVAGVTRPMMYIGMMFTTFCWHVEDNYLYSINYNHFGQPKLWYGVPGWAAENFERTMRTCLPDLFRRNPNLLHLLVTQLSPRELQNSGIPVFTALQSEGQFVVTCPRSYHAGFNTGYNCAESVNFALEDWLPFCRKACDNYRFNRSAIFPFEEFVMMGAQRPDNPKIAEIFKSEILSIIQKEQTLQSKIYREGITKYVMTKSEKYVPCCVCGYDCFLSGVRCNSHPGLMVCLHHVAGMCGCPATEKRLVVRVHLMELKVILDDLPNKVVGGGASGMSVVPVGGACS